MVFTDPPYGVSYKSDTQGTIQNDEHRDNALVNKLLVPAFKNAVAAADDDAAFFIWHASSTKQDFDWALKAAGLEEKQIIIWIKPTFALGRADYHWQHEPCIYAQKCGHKARYLANRDQATVWTVTARGEHKGDMAIANGVRLSQESGQEIFIKAGAPKGMKSRLVRLAKGETINLTGDDSATDTWNVSQDNKTSYIHPTQKPIELAARAIRNHTERDEVVLDLFAGSGSTLIAGEKTERRVDAMELEEKFVDAIVTRYARFNKSNKRPYSIKLNGKDITAEYAEIEA